MITTESFKRHDEQDPLNEYKGSFARPHPLDFRGNSLGAQPKPFVGNMINQIRIWEGHGHDGHFYKDSVSQPWWKFHEMFEPLLQDLLGCNTNPELPEATIGGTLSANNQFLLSYFLRKNSLETKKEGILSVETFFPSDIASMNMASYLVYGSCKNKYLPSNGNGLVRTEDILRAIRHSNTAIIWLPGVGYKTGQRYDFQKITEVAHENGMLVGFDLAHAIGNIKLYLNDWNIDFATWCGYKYLNGGPGAAGGIYINKKHFQTEQSFNVPGWWGYDKSVRFGNASGFRPAKGARQFLASNDQIFNSIGVLSQLQIVKEFGFKNIIEKHEKISTYLYNLISQNIDVEIITPEEWENRGCQISFRHAKAKEILKKLEDKYVFVENRDDVIRMAPVAYNSFSEVNEAVCILDDVLKTI